MPASSQYHVILDGQGYLIELDSYRKTVHSPFAPKRRAGDPRYGDLALTSVWAQESWRLGLGFPTWSSKWDQESAGYDQGYPIDARFGDLRLGRNLATVYQPGAAVSTDIPDLIHYSGKLYASSADPAAPAATVQESSDGSTWSTSFTHTAGAGGKFAVFNGWLILGYRSGGRISKYDGSTWTDTWVTGLGGQTRSTPTVYPLSGTDYLWVVADSTTGNALLRRIDTGAVVTTVLTLSWPAAEAMAAYDGLLWIATIDDRNGQLRGALYTYDGAKLSEVDLLPDNAIASFQPYRGALYAGSVTRGKVWRVSTKGLEEVFSVPDVAVVGAGGAGGVSSYSMPIRKMAVDDGRLILPILDTQGLGLYAFDGVGWSHIAAGGAGQQPRAVQPFKGDLYLSSQSATGARIYRVERKSPASATWLSASFTAGLPSVFKVFHSLELHHAPLSSGEAITVAYEVEGSGVWNTLGTSATPGSSTASFSFPTATLAKRLRLRLTVSVTDQTKTPRVRGILVHYLVAQEVKPQWTFAVRLEGSVEAPLARLDNSNEPKTGAQLSSTLWQSRAKKQQLSFTDLNGETQTVWFVDLEERVAKASQRLGHQTLGYVTLVQA